MSVAIHNIDNQYFYSISQKRDGEAVQSRSFMDTLANVSVDSVLSDLEKRFGTKINVEAIGKSQKETERLAFRCSGNSNVTIAPNALERMATDPVFKQKINQKIQDHFDSIPANEQYLASRGFTMVASGVTVHEDGTVTYWVFQDQTPEEKERIRQLQEAEDKAKAKTKEAYAEVAKRQLNNRIVWRMDSMNPHIGEV